MIQRATTGRLPPPLSSGDRIQIISPAGPIQVGSLSAAVEFLQNAGYQVDVSAHAYDKDGYLAGSDESRLNDLVDALFDEDIQAIICSRGGYGSQRLLDAIPWESLKNVTPKTFIGFSDIGVLQTGLWLQAGWSSFSGLQAVNGFNSIDETEAKRYFLTILSGHWKGRSGWSKTKPITLAHVSHGICEGVLYPICLSMLVSMIGTPFFPNLSGVILCLEDVGEAPYRIDRLFWQLANSGCCDGLAGLILGEFLSGEESVVDAALQSVAHHFGSFNVPVWRGIPYGHFEDRLTLPFAVNCHIDADGALYYD